MRVLGWVVVEGFFVAAAFGHGSVISPESRVHRVYASNPENPSFQLAKNAVQTDGTISYYTWHELSRNIPAAVNAGLPPGFDYSPWVPDGQLASGGRVDPSSTAYPRTYAGLDQVSAAWPTSPAQAGAVLPIRFDAHTPHEPSVWDVWMTTADWLPTQPLNWGQMEFLGRPNVTLSGMEYNFNVQIPANRAGHQVLWIAWQRDDAAGEVFFSTSDSHGDASDDRTGRRFQQQRSRRLGGLHSVARPVGGSGRDASERCGWWCDWDGEYARWRANFGARRAAGQTAAQIPEPGAGLFALMGLVRVAARRKLRPGRFGNLGDAQ